MEYAEKSMVKTTLITLGILIALMIVFLAVMSFFFPKQMSNVCAKYGLDGLAVKYAESQYKKSSNINDLHTLIYRAYEANDNGVVIKYSEKLFNSSKYEEFIVYINDLNMKNVPEEQAQIALTNENDYLKNQYVRALCKKGNFEKAATFALNELEKESDWALPKKVTWLLGSLLTYQNASSTPSYEFLQTQNLNNETYLELTLVYLDKMIDEFNSLKADVSIMENGEYYKNVLAYELNQYLTHIIFLEDKVVLPINDFAYYRDVQTNL